MVTMSILAKKLRPLCGCRVNREVFSDRPLSEPMIFDGSRLHSNIVYVAQGSQLGREHLYGMSVICAGEPPFGLENLSCDLIVTDVSDTHVLFNMVQKVFFSILRWESLLDSAIGEQLDIRALLDIGRQELPFSFFYLNSQFSLKAVSLRENAGDLDEKSLMDDILKDKAVGMEVPTDYPRYFCSNTLGIHGYFYNFYYGKDYRGKLLAAVPADVPLDSADLTLLETLCGQMNRIFRLFSISPLSSQEYNVLRKALYALLTGTEETTQQVVSLMAQTQWNMYDSYLLCFVPFDGEQVFSSRGEYLITMLENRCRTAVSRRALSSKGVALGDGVALTVRLIPGMEGGDEKEKDYLAALLPELQKALEPLQGKMGVSCLCNNFLKLPLALRQAMSAVRIGSQRHPDKTVFRFSEYTLDYIIENSVSTFQWEDMVHPCIQTLLCYDRENNTELCKTLRVFIRCRYNVLQASNMLYVHRSTFSVRIRRIETMCGIDLEDEPTRLHILLSYYIMEAKGLLEA